MYGKRLRQHKRSGSFAGCLSMPHNGPLFREARTHRGHAVHHVWCGQETVPAIVLWPGPAVRRTVAPTDWSAAPVACSRGERFGSESGVLKGKKTKFPKLQTACSSCVQRLVAVGDWRLVAVGGGWRRLVDGDWWLVVGGGWWLAVGGWQRLPVGGWWSLGVGLKGGP